MTEKEDRALIAWVVFRGILVTIVIAGLLSLLPMIFLPEISDPISDEEKKLSIIFGIGIWIISIILGRRWTIGYWDKLKGYK